MSNWQNRIVGYRTEAASQLAGHPMNPRRHPQKQRDAVRGSLDTLGWIAPIINNVRTGYIIDGHERVMQALGMGDDTPVPVIDVDLSEAEEAQALATFDFITYMAEYDRTTLDDLLRATNSDDKRVQSLLSDLAQEQGVVLPDVDAWQSAFDSLPDEDRAPFQQMTFTLHDSQVEIVKDAIKSANELGDYSTANENSNGNALARICELFMVQHGKS